MEEKYRLIKEFSLENFIRREDDDTNYYYLDTGKYLSKEEFETLYEVADINDFIVEDPKEGGEYLTVTYGKANVEIPKFCFTKIKEPISFDDRAYLIRGFINFEEMEKFISDRLFEGFEIMSTDPLSKRVEMIRNPKNKSKTSVKE